MWQQQGPEDGFAGSSGAARAPWWGALLYDRLCWSVRRRSRRGGVKPTLDLFCFEINAGGSRAADSSVSRWMSIEDCNTQNFPSVCSFYLAALALGFAWLRCMLFCFAGPGPLQSRAISPVAQREGCVRRGKRCRKAIELRKPARQY